MGGSAYTSTGLLPEVAGVNETEWTKPKISSLPWVVVSVRPLLTLVFVPAPAAVLSSGAAVSPENSLTSRSQTKRTDQVSLRFATSPEVRENKARPGWSTGAGQVQQSRFAVTGR